MRNELAEVERGVRLGPSSRGLVGGCPLAQRLVTPGQRLGRWSEGLADTESEWFSEAGVNSQH